jgi:integrase
LANGRRCFKSTKKAKKKDAEEVKRGWAKAVDAAGRGDLTEVQAKKILDEILESAGEGPIQTKTVREFFDNWLAGKKLSVKEGTFPHYKKSVLAFLDSLGSRADKSLSSLSPSDIEKFRDARTKLGVSAVTIGQDVGLVRRALNTARKQAFILHNPAEGVDLPRASSHERLVFRADEVERLLAVAPPDWKTAILLGYYAGLRLSDAVSLSWDKVELSEGVLSYTQGKTGKKVEVPIHHDLEEHLLSIARDDPRGLCPTLAKCVTGGGRGLSNQFADLMGKANIDCYHVESSRNHKISLKSFHSLRHSFTSALANAGISADVRMKLTGHRSVDVHQRYTHMELEPLRQAIAALPTLRADRTENYGTNNE